MLYLSRASMLSIVPQQAVLDQNRVVDTWIDDMLIAHGLWVNDRDSHIQGPLLPKPYPSPAMHSNLSSSLLYAIHLPNRRGKKKRHGHPLQSKDPNMDSTSSQPPLSPPKQTATKKWFGKARRKEKSDKTEESVPAQGKEARKPEHTHNTRAASAALSQAEPSRGPQTEPSRDPQAELSRGRVTEQYGSGGSLFNQVHLLPPVNSTVASAFDANAALVSRPKPRPESTAGQSEASARQSQATTRQSQSTTKGSNARSKSPVKSMADLSLADKPIVPTQFGNDIAQLPLDIREIFERLMILNDGEEILPTIIKVSTLSGRA